MLAVLRLQPDAYGMGVRREIEVRAGRGTAIGAVYATLDRLERKGLMLSSETVCEGGKGRARRLYVLTADGGSALEQARKSIARMWKGVKVNYPKHL